MKTHPGAELFLSRFAEGEWQGVVRPWLERARGRLERALVVAPTRGHTHALKQRCIVEGVPLLGVEFLTPGLARRKRAARAGPGRSLELLLLRSRIDERLAPLAPDDPARLVWKSLASDLEAALDDFYELLRAGFRPADFPRAELRELFGHLADWIGSHGYALGPLEDEGAAAGPPPGSAPVADRILILGGGAEGWGEFFGLAALAHRCASLCVAISEPEFGPGATGETWVELWEKQLGVEAALVDAPDPADSCADVAALWSGDAGSAEKAGVIVGRSMPDEMERVADALASLLARGADNVAVVFPKADAAHALLSRILLGRGIAFADMIGASGTPPVEVRIQQAIADFLGKGCRLEELLNLWPLLCSLSLSSISPAQARAVCGRLFGAAQAHGVEAHLGALETSRKGDWREVGRVARMLLPGLPARLTLADALARFEAARDRLKLAEAPGWPNLREFARRAEGDMPAGAILDAIRAFLPGKGPLAGSPGAGGFAHVTLTTARRAAGLAWSHAILVEANRGVWPERREPSCWLGDDERRELNKRARFSLGLATREERAAVERRLFSAIARDTREGFFLSASAQGEEEPKAALEPNPWLERVMWKRGLLKADAGSEALRRLAGEATAPAAPARGHADRQKAWAGVWARRRDPSAPFDEFFFSEPGGENRPSMLAAHLIEDGARDPVRLWFGAVLKVERVEWRPFARARGRSEGEAVHRVLAEALRGAPAEGAFARMPGRKAAEARLEAELAALRARWPSNRYWDSFHMDVCGAARDLLGRVYRLPGGPFAAAEVRLPDEATVPVGAAGRIKVRGQLDLVLSDRPGWGGAQVEIADFKTGADAPLSARRMASSGASLQLGVYLEAARSLGAAGSVWMLKPGEEPSRIGMDELAVATARLAVIGAHLSTGIYGALTPDRDEFTHVFEWPLACAPISSAILRRKFERTFGAGGNADG